MFRIGEKLNEAKTLVPGSWGRWCGKHIEMSKRQADNYIRLDEHSETLLPNGNPVPILLANPSVKGALKILKKTDTVNSTKPKRLHPLITQLNKEGDFNFETTQDLLEALRGTAPKVVKTKAFQISYNMKEVAVYLDVTLEELRALFERYKKEKGGAPDLNNIQDVLTFAYFIQDER